MPSTEAERIGLSRLIAKGLAGQWSPESGIDWDLPVRMPGWIARKPYVSAVSQLRHGELATVAMCRRLIGEVDDPRARRFLALQIADETRHARVYEAYLKRLGDDAPIDAAVQAAFDGGMAWTGSHCGLIVAFHVVLEGEALRLQRGFAERMPCPLFRRINERIARDETRHIAFGRIYLRERVPALPRDERFAIFRWVESVWRECARATLDAYRVPGIAAGRGRRGWLAARWAAQVGTLTGIGLVTADEVAQALCPGAL